MKRPCVNDSFALTQAVGRNPDLSAKRPIPPRIAFCVIAPAMIILAVATILCAGNPSLPLAFLALSMALPNAAVIFIFAAEQTFKKIKTTFDFAFGIWVLVGLYSYFSGLSDPANLSIDSVLRELAPEWTTIVFVLVCGTMMVRMAVWIAELNRPASQKL